MNRSWLDFRHKNVKPPKAGHKKKDIGSNIAEVWDAKPAAPIGKVMVGERLWSSRNEQRRNSHGSRQGQKDPNGRTTRKHRPHCF